jgi:hypothetical protein
MSNFAQTSCVARYAFQDRPRVPKRIDRKAITNEKSLTAKPTVLFVEDEMTLRLRADDFVHRSKTQSFSITSSALPWARQPDGAKFGAGDIDNMQPL